jgi:hypothetical protein
MKRLTWKLGIGGICAAAISLWWLFAQAAPQPLAALFPSGALLYLEAKDFRTLVADWNGSVERRAWLASANYQVFARSRLLLKMADAQGDFAKAAGVPPDYAMLQSVAGGESALAIYDIGKLEFLYASRLDQARVLNTALWRARGSYQTRRAGGVEYYVREDRDSHRTAAFTYAGGLLLAATREDLVSGALQLLARQARPSLAGETWFADAVQAAAPGDRDLRMVYNLERLAGTFHFRSYWVQRNVGDLREFRSGLADLERVRGEMRERRVLLRSSAGADQTASESAAGQLLALAPDAAGLYRVWANPSLQQVGLWIGQKLFETGGAGAPDSKLAPAVSADGVAGGEQDLEIRIDEPALADDRAGAAFTALGAQIEAVKLQAMLEVENTRVDANQVFVRPQAALVLLADRAWDAAAIRTALTAAANGLWTSAGLGAGWRAAASGANGVQEMDGLGALAMAVDGNRLIVGNSTALVNAVLARRAQPAVAGAVYAAGWKHARELPNFERISRLIDFPQISGVTTPAPQDGADASQGREPQFYSENAASLGRVLGRVDTATITVHDPGPMLRETVVYRLTP